MQAPTRVPTPVYVPLLFPHMWHRPFAALPSRAQVVGPPEAYFVPVASRGKATAERPSIHHISILNFF